MIQILFLTADSVQNSFLYVIPIESVLGRLSLFPACDMGTIPFESTARNRAEREPQAHAVRHWQKGNTPVLSVIRRRALTTVADCGVSMCLP